MTFYMQPIFLSKINLDSLLYIKQPVRKPFSTAVAQKQLVYFIFSDSSSIIRNLKIYQTTFLPSPNPDQSFFSHGFYSMLNGIFHQRLQRQLNDPFPVDFRINLDLIINFITVTYFLNLNIIFNIGDLLLHRNQGFNIT